MKKIFKNKMFWLIFSIVFLLFLFWLFKIADHYPRRMELKAKDDFWGLTYSPKFATELGLDWQKVYLDILDDLQVKNIRMPIYWDQIAKTDGEYDFSQYDYIFDQGKSRDVKFIANIGWRLPRWPECHAPSWLNTSDVPMAKDKTIAMLEKVIEHFKDRSEIVAWQIENEPLFDWFGQCPNGDKNFLQKEVDLVKSLDNNRPIVISASGELASWKTEGQISDIFGTTVYRVVWNKWFKYVHYPIPAWYYRLKARLYGIDTSQAIIAELQTEPWVPEGTLANLNYTEYEKSFSVEQFKANLQFAINIDFKQSYMWGVEWWYVQKNKGNSEYWDVAKSIFKN